MDDTAWAQREDWEQAWRPLVDAVGTDFGPGARSEAIDAIERGAVRKYLEPLEMDCPIHYDEDVARAHGYGGIPAPVSGISQTWIETGVWTPGRDPAWPAAERDAPPPRPPAAGGAIPTPAPPTSAGFATDIEIEYHRDAYVGDRLTSSGNRLISCVPKQTSVGRGAFQIFESYVHNQKGDLIATVRRGLYAYVPFG